ncbi:hypothetical protein CB1_000321003 [Camelus ferus]|nr:hypothetical protein CB1_000321003 [Camelus ferus]
MPRYYEDKPEGGACAGVKEDLGACLLQSDCVLQCGLVLMEHVVRGQVQRERCAGPTLDSSEKQWGPSTLERIWACQRLVILKISSQLLLPVCKRQH